MNSIVHSPVNIQTSSESVASTPGWFGEVTVIAHFLKQQGVLAAIEEQVRFARRRFGHYDTIDFVIVLLGYAISGERTLETFYERVQPFASAFMALFDRERLPHRSTLSRFLAALDRAPVEALRTLFLKDMLARPLQKEESAGGLWDREGTHYLVFDVDGTRQAARQRALPASPGLPAAHRRLQEVCAPGYVGRKRGEVVRTRTMVLQAHSHQWCMISGIWKIPTYQQLCGFDPRFLCRFQGQRGSIPHKWAPSQGQATATIALSCSELQKPSVPISKPTHFRSVRRWCVSMANMAMGPLLSI